MARETWFTSHAAWCTASEPRHGARDGARDRHSRAARPGLFPRHRRHQRHGPPDLAAALAVSVAAASRPPLPTSRSTDARHHRATLASARARRRRRSSTRGCSHRGRRSCRSRHHQARRTRAHRRRPPRDRGASASMVAEATRERRITMRATVMHGAGDVRIESVPDARLSEPTDALVRVTRAAVCGSDLWPYKSMQPSETGRRMGHEFIGVVEDVGADVRSVSRPPGRRRSSTRTATASSPRRTPTSCLHGGDTAPAVSTADRAKPSASPTPTGPRRAADRPRRSADAFADAHGRDGDRPPRGSLGARRSQQDGRRRRRRRRRSVRRDRRTAARCGQIILLGRHPDRVALARSSAQPTS
jgi:hypothetical protein